MYIVCTMYIMYVCINILLQNNIINHTKFKNVNSMFSIGDKCFFSSSNPSYCKFNYMFSYLKINLERLGLVKKIYDIYNNNIITLLSFKITLYLNMTYYIFKMSRGVSRILYQGQISFLGYTKQIFYMYRKFYCVLHTLLPEKIRDILQ